MATRGRIGHGTATGRPQNPGRRGPRRRGWVVEAAGRAGAGLLDRLGRGLRELGLWLCCSQHSRWRQLEALRRLDDQGLKDVGITSAEARSGRREPGSGRH